MLVYEFVDIWKMAKRGYYLDLDNLWWKRLLKTLETITGLSKTPQACGYADLAEFPSTMSRLNLPTLIEALLFCLLFSTLTAAERAAGTGAPSTGQKKYNTARTMRGAGLERNVELVRNNGIYYSIPAYTKPNRPYPYEPILYTRHMLIPVSVARPRRSLTPC